MQLPPRATTFLPFARADSLHPHKTSDIIEGDHTHGCYLILPCRMTMPKLLHEVEDYGNPELDNPPTIVTTERPHTAKETETKTWARNRSAILTMRYLRHLLKPQRSHHRRWPPFWPAAMPLPETVPQRPCQAPPKSYPWSRA